MNVIKSHLQKLARGARYPVPASLMKRQRLLSSEGRTRLERSIRTYYHKGPRAQERYPEKVYRADLAAHLTGRLDSDRRIIVPWLNAARPVAGARILEIGCGTGSSTIALAEQGAIVSGIDVDEDSLTVARERCEIYGVQAELLCLNVIDAAEAFKGRSFDLVIFFATLEHLTMDERLTALPAMWNLLPAGGLMVIIETPNRLWYYDEHTALMPFFNWLPDDLAFQFSRYSDRRPFKDDFREPTPEAVLQFKRRGRGASYHELEATCGLPDVVSSLSSFHGWRHVLKRSIRDRVYKALIKSVRSNLHDGFYEPWLDLILRKPV